MEGAKRAVLEKMEDAECGFVVGSVLKLTSKKKNQTEHVVRFVNALLKQLDEYWR